MVADLAIEAFAQAHHAPTLEDKVRFLSDPASYRPRPHDVLTHETHMSWVFLAGERAYKLKKPVHYPYLDFSTLARREAACRAELRLNRRLARDVYLGVVPLTAAPALAIDGTGQTVDWLIVMRRLDPQSALEQMIKDDTATPAHIDALAIRLIRFYRRTAVARFSATQFLHRWQRNLADNHRVLLDPSFSVPRGTVRFVDRAQRRFLREKSEILLGRWRKHRILDGHGDLRPEHIWFGSPARIIDCLEFDPQLRAVDPFDEIAFLDVECTRLGAPWIGKHLHRRLTSGTGDAVPDALYTFYRCYRATLRARLSIAHLLTPNPRTPEKWPRLMKVYLEQALRDAVTLERLLNSPGDR